MPLFILTILFTIVVWIAQVIAIADGLAFWLGIPPVITYIVALLFGWVPPFAPVIAFVAALQVWGWPVLGAFALFFGVYILYGLLFALGALNIYASVKWVRARLKERQRSQIIEHDPNL